MKNGIGYLIKEMRKSKRMTQQQLADASNISRSYLSDVENDRNNPSIRLLKSISKGLSNGDEKESRSYFMKFMAALSYI